MLFRDERPLLFFGAFAALFAAAGLVLGGSVVVEYMETGLVPRLPTAILATGLMLLAFLALGCGLILDHVVRGAREAKRLGVSRAIGGAAGTPVRRHGPGGGDGPRAPSHVTGCARGGTIPEGSSACWSAPRRTSTAAGAGRGTRCPRRPGRRKRQRIHRAAMVADDANHGILRQRLPLRVVEVVAHAQVARIRGKNGST